MYRKLNQKELKNIRNVRNQVNENNYRNIVELLPHFDSAKSFYKKAMIGYLGKCNGSILLSYNTPVVYIHCDNVYLLSDFDLSQTTLRHVKEWLTQTGKINPGETLAKLKRDFITLDDNWKPIKIY